MVSLSLQRCKNKWLHISSLLCTVLNGNVSLVTADICGDNCTTHSDVVLIAPYLDGVIVGLAGFCVGLVWHEPRLQQVLVKTVPKSSNRGVIWREGGKRKSVKKCGIEQEEWETDKWERNYSFISTLPQSRWQSATYGIKSVYGSLGCFFFSTPTMYWQHVSSHFPFCLPFPWCAHISMSPVVLVKVYTAFMAVLICTTQRGWDTASAHSDHTKKITYSL